MKFAFLCLLNMPKKNLQRISSFNSETKTILYSWCSAWLRWQLHNTWQIIDKCSWSLQQNTGIEYKADQGQADFSKEERETRSSERDSILKTLFRGKRNRLFCSPTPPSSTPLLIPVQMELEGPSPFLPYSSPIYPHTMSIQIQNIPEWKGGRFGWGQRFEPAVPATGVTVNRRQTVPAVPVLVVLELYKSIWWFIFEVYDLLPLSCVCVLW